MFELTGLGGLILLALDIWALISIFSSTAPTGTKVLWTLLVVFLPLVGFLLWIFLGPKGNARTT
ncbi:PLD nuclease N-terminal domain-containing protein [Maritimibacter fusiformis]|uniref:PLDc_N domain-containing protein n=1 Tax=Maritimibacter fusiformis TaxID=2603819 RepID=A0A5D0RN27_9RHOB|nr:PLD nuclease N-terminal domain-containing protein [Maritimibacter fusiformis]TYB81984.1 PLDc_N domain-containing protein [Maritimibacter fusiformis]